ncbi:uncharacterized protein LOC129239412 isoform X2 [Anastrepha obliqua]|uniref:uncharacterized protein LOC129239412 isoform X2 n=1 Tax=Anastrepha obliqua TaxID=95512 RepID=UPI0024098F37|nr:uncharacterized protein LOC129239412 isoform X2 [Anastrepha obliqua]
MNFSQKLIVQLIECLKNEPALWQIKNENYKNKIEKTLAWDRILETYRKSDPHATIDELKKKIASLRASHRRELQKIRKTKRSRAGADAIYVPSLWYFEHLDFLRHQKNRIEGAATSDKSSIMKSRLQLSSSLGHFLAPIKLDTIPSDLCLVRSTHTVHKSIKHHFAAIVVLLTWETKKRMTRLSLQLFTLDQEKKRKKGKQPNTSKKKESR